jgi:hypothetical protein
MTRAIALRVALRLLWSNATMIIGSALLYTALTLNLQHGSRIPWSFPFAACICWLSVFSSSQPEQPRVSLAKATRFYVWGSCALVFLILTGLSIATMNFQSVVLDQTGLFGDDSQASTLVRVVTSLTVLGGGGIIEESAIRGVVQLGLRNDMRPVVAEVIAGLEFVVSHVPRFSIPGEPLFVILLAFFNGRITARMQTMRYAILVHSLANIAIGTAIWLFRSHATKVA